MSTADDESNLTLDELGHEVDAIQTQRGELVRLIDHLLSATYWTDAERRRILGYREALMGPI